MANTVFATGVVTLTLVGPAPTLLRSETFPGVATLTCVGPAPTLLRSETFPGVATMTLVGPVPTLLRSETLPGVATIGCVGRAPTTVRSEIIFPIFSISTMRLVGLAPTVVRTETIASTGIGQGLFLLGRAPTLVLPGAELPAPPALTLVGQAPDVALSSPNFSMPVTVLGLSGRLVDLDKSSPFIVTPNRPASVLVARFLDPDPHLTIVPASEYVTIIDSGTVVIPQGGATFGPSPYAGTSLNSGTFVGGTAVEPNRSLYDPVFWFDEGVILCTGLAERVHPTPDLLNIGAPKFDDGNLLLGQDAGAGPGVFPLACPGVAGHPALDAYQRAFNSIFPTSSDACVLKFDFIPEGDQIYFEWGFGSMEYEEWVGSPFNDTMLILLDGVNIATLPGTDVVVSTNNVYPESTQDEFGHEEFYKRHFWELVKFDGLVGSRGDPNDNPPKQKLYALADVTPGVSHHLEIIVGDMADGILNTGIFLFPTFKSIVSATEPEFENGVTTIGLTWMIVTLRDGTTQYVWSDRPLPDPSTYYLGWKAPRVLKWGRIRRALSSVIDGQYETTDFTVTLDDTDRFLRGLGDELVNAGVVVYMISDADRRALLTARTVYRGVIKEAKPTGTLEMNLTVKDTFAEQFSASNTTNLIPRRVILQADFPNCAMTRVKSSADGYVVDGAVVYGETLVPIRDGSGSFAPGDRITIGGLDYTVSTSSQATVPGLDPETSIEVNPALIADLADGDAITVREAHDIEPSLGKRVPFPYGHITDLKFDAGEDLGDGQAPLIYVGDRVLDDGKTYGEFLWAGWACYSPSDCPFSGLYFWNGNIVNGFGAYFPELPALADEADVGGRIALPGFPNWLATTGLTTSYRDYNGRRYTVLYLRGIYRDWALGITPAPVNLGGQPFGVCAYGADDIGDGTGALITNLLKQYKHAVQNLCPPKGEGYQSGAWLASPTFADTPTLSMIDEASFDDADAQSAIYVPGGFRGDFIIGFNDEAVTARELIARFNVSSGVQSGFNRKIQYFVSMVNRDLGTIALADALGWVRDIFAGTFAIDAVTRDLYTAIAFQHTQDYLGRVDGGWRSTTVDSGVTEVENAGAALAYGKTTYATMQFYMLRGQNRSTDSDDYARGTLTIEAVLALALARLSNVQHLPALQTGPGGFSYELADTVPITHYEGLAEDGWTDEPVRIERAEIDPAEYVEVLEGYQIAPILL